ncbi:unnamed protein product, partial [Ilex paraguariensis]
IEIKHIQYQKMMHHHAILLVKYLCEETIKLDHVLASSILKKPLHIAAANGAHEVVEEILYSFPSAAYFLNKQKQLFLHIAIANRRERVFNLIYQFEDLGHQFLRVIDMSRNNGLHLAGYLERSSEFNIKTSAVGAALQMQREIQWFKEVEKCSLPQDKERKNDQGKTPMELFSETHEKLIKEGGKWMKDTSTSCTIVAALIVTIVFAATITVPGGNNEGSNNSDNGFPVFSKEKAFIIFAIADAIALVLSSSSVLVFLSILTSRYEADDFLKVLPIRVLVGLVTLFLSIIFMVVAFGATTFLVFGHKKAWILIPVATSACLPVSLFASLQFPLLFDMLKSTCGPGIFGKQGDRKLY